MHFVRYESARHFGVINISGFVLVLMGLSLVLLQLADGKGWMQISLLDTLQWFNSVRVSSVPWWSYIQPLLSNIPLSALMIAVGSLLVMS